MRNQIQKSSGFNVVTMVTKTFLSLFIPLKGFFLHFMYMIIYLAFCLFTANVTMVIMLMLFAYQLPPLYVIYLCKCLKVVVAMVMPV